VILRKGSLRRKGYPMLEGPKKMDSQKSTAKAEEGGGNIKIKREFRVGRRKELWKGQWAGRLRPKPHRDLIGKQARIGRS